MKRVIGGLAIAVTAVVGFASGAQAHGLSVKCTDRATSTWTITNDDSHSVTFTSPQGPSGSIAAGNGSKTIVTYVGTSLTINGVWSDQFQGSTTGTGNCVPIATTTTTTSTTSTTTTSTTVPETTTTVTTVPESTSTVATTAPTTTGPTSTFPICDDGTGPNGECLPPPTPVPTITTCVENPALCEPAPAERETTTTTVPLDPVLPETGSNTNIAMIAALVLGGGAGLARIARRRS